MIRSVIYKIQTKRGVCLVALAAGFVIWAAWNAHRAQPVHFDFTSQHFKDLNSASEASFPGPQDRSIRIIHFWASWCGPCQHELPSLFAAIPALTPQIQFFLISTDEQPEAAREFLRHLSAPVPEPARVIWDEGQRLAHIFSVTLLPETFILDADGNLIREISGVMNWQDPANLKYLKSLGPPHQAN